MATVVVQPEAEQDERRLARKKREAELRKDLGVSAETAAAAAALGGEMLGRGAVQAPAGVLYELLRGGRNISPADDLRPIENIAEFTKSELKAIKSFAAEHGVKVPIVGMGSASSSFYQPPSGPLAERLHRLLGSEPAKPFIGLTDTSLPGAFHEIGHASETLKGAPRTSRAIQSVVSASQPGSPLGMLVRAILSAQVLSEPTEDSSGARRFLYEHAPELVGATYVPFLAEEARASAKALAGARRHGVGLLAAAKELAPALGTHASSMAGAVFGTLLAKKLLETLRAKKDGEEKKASPLSSNPMTAWKMGGNPPKPKTTTTGPATKAKSNPPAAPPSKTPYYNDMLKSLTEPARGQRMAVPEAPKLPQLG